MYITYWIYYGYACEKNYFDLLRNQYYINDKSNVECNNAFEPYTYLKKFLPPYNQKLGISSTLGLSLTG
jgi:hypothetical protein